jgi:hypothetical protein
MFTSRNKIFESGRVPVRSKQPSKANGEWTASTFYLIVLGLELGIEVDIIINTQSSLDGPIDAIRQRTVMNTVDEHSWSHCNQLSIGQRHEKSKKCTQRI